VAKVGSQGYIQALSDEAQFADKTTVRRHKPDYQIVLYMGLLMLIGLIIMYAIGPQRANVLNNAYGSEYGSMYFFIKQLVSLGVAIVAFWAMAFVPYTWFTRHAGKIVMISFGACALLFLAGLANLGIAQQTLGATRWFNLGSLGSFQPAEMLKYAILIFLAGFLGGKAKQAKLNNAQATLIPVAIITAISMIFIVIIQKDFGTGVSLLGIIISMLVVSGLNVKNAGIIILIIMLIGGALIVSAPHRLDRFMTFLNGDNMSSNDPNSYHIDQAKLAIGTGGLFGVGVGNSVQATGYLPEATNDSVFAIIGETFGFVGLLTVLALFTALLMRLLKLMDHLVDIRLKLLIAGAFGWLGSHVMLNVASMVGVIPLTGITLPLLSFGGTSLIFIAAVLGLVFQLSHYTVHPSSLKEARYEDSSSRRGIGRSRHAGRSGFTRN